MSCPVRIALVARLVLGALLFLPSVPQAGPPAPRCLPTSGPFSACQGNTGSVGPGACTGIQACFSNSGDIAKNACQSDFACSFNEGSVGESACHGGAQACAGNKGQLSKDSCVGPVACA